MVFTFSEQVRTMIRRENMTLQDIADKLGVTRQAVSQNLNKGDFTLSNMEKYAAALDCDLIIDLVPRSGASPGEK
jgi:transcriptional regulator with XRE-family HTH domain